jgi:hypothetical protein
MKCFLLDRRRVDGTREDLEDRYLAETRLEKRGKPYTSAQARRELGLDN